MGYEVHITRAKSWSENQANRIAAEAWLEVVRQDPSLRLNPANGPYFAEWGQDGWLDWSDGNIYSKSPTPALINKMAEIASRLGAAVQGDDGEHYPLTSAAQVTNRAGVSDTIRSLLQQVSARFRKTRSAPTPSFKVGDRVVDAW